MTEDSHPIALVIGAAHAEEAGATGSVKAAQNPLADVNPGDILPRALDGADELVADGKARHHLHSAVVDVEVGPADAAGQHRHARVVAAWQLGSGALTHQHMAGRQAGDS